MRNFLINFKGKANCKILIISIAFSILFLNTFILTARSASSLIAVQPFVVQKYEDGIAELGFNISPNGDYCAVYYRNVSSGIYDLKMYNTPNGSAQEFTPIWNKTSDYLLTFGFSKLGSKFLVTNYMRNTTSMYTLPSSTPDWTKSFIRPVCDRDNSINDDGSLVVIRTYESGKQGVLLLNGTNGEIIWRRDYPTSGVYGMRITEKKNVFVSVSTDKRIEKIDINNQTLWNKTYTYNLYQMELARNESLFICTDCIKNITFIDPNSGNVLHHKSFTEQIQNLKVSEDGSRAVVSLSLGGELGKIISISPSTYEIIKEAINLPRGYVQPLDTRLDNFLVYSDGYSNAFYIMDTESMIVKFNRTLTNNKEYRIADSSFTAGIFGTLLDSGYLYLFSCTYASAIPVPPSFLDEMFALFSKPINWIGLSVMALLGVILGYFIGKKRK